MACRSKLTGDLTNQPSVAVQGNATISMGGSDVDIQLVVIDGTLYAALTPNNWLDMGPASDVYDPSVILNPDNGLANMLVSLSRPSPRRAKPSTGSTRFESAARSAPTPSTSWCPS